MKKEFVTASLPTDFCHGSTILQLADGSFLCAWFGGSKEGNADTAIWLSRREQNAWSVPQKLADGAEANWNPVLFAFEDTVYLFYKEGQSIARWKTWCRKSADAGRTWGEPRELVKYDCGGRGPVRNKPILLHNGSILAGGSLEKGLWTAFADLSADGINWTRSDSIKIADLSYCEGEKTAESDIEVSEQSFYGRGVIQPTLWQSSANCVHMLLRSSEGYIYRSDSSDGGRSWNDAYPLTVPNNNSGIDMVKAKFNQQLYLVCNPNSSNWGMRSPLSLYHSCDNGLNWHKIYDLETEPGEFSYPAIISDEQGLYITYTWKRKNIVFCSIVKDELLRQ